MNQALLFLFFAACFVLTLFLIYQGMKLINKAKQATSEVKQKVKDAALATDTFISCPKCHAKLRVPKGKGSLKITCPKCKHRFQHNSGTLRNDLDLYRPGGPLRSKPSFQWGPAIEKLPASMIQALAVECGKEFYRYYNWDGDVGSAVLGIGLGGRKTRESNGDRILYVDVKFTPTELICSDHERLRIKNGAEYMDLVSDRTVSYTKLLKESDRQKADIDSRSKGNRDPRKRWSFTVPDDLALSSKGLEMLTHMTYTQLIDAHPTAFMHDGRLYPHGRKSASGSSVQTSKR
ncbi:MAG: zinc-ribbon domain-containing protein [Clostridiales bacterium]|nr:zinc-ribbon domain-containing protein [Clostridiales bacterium]